MAVCVLSFAGFVFLALIPAEKKHLDPRRPSWSYIFLRSRRGRGIADRYLLPVFRRFCFSPRPRTDSHLIPSAPLAGPGSRRSRAAVALVLAVPVVADYPRTSAHPLGLADDRCPVDRNPHPGGSYLVVEPYGPDIFGPQVISELTPT